MRLAPKIFSFFPILALLVFSNFLIAQDVDLDDELEVTARVARISAIEGNVQIKRLGENEWEAASLNFPIVEGDEIAVSNNAKLEIQFDDQNFLRVSEGSLVKITTLRDDGISVSLSEGTLSLRVYEFDKEKTFFEIDAPHTMISVQTAGIFRIDAKSTDQVKITAFEDGQVRVYSESSAFLIRGGRSATIFLTDDRLGEWETGDLASFSDSWDTWVAERDVAIGQLRANALASNNSNVNAPDYGQDIYGAADLNDYGSWGDSDDYGRVWRPNPASISVYDNWSPYRYGRWTWLSPFGWTWVGAEPWGWSTYHYGRWINDGRGWCWAPYSYYQRQNNVAINRGRRNLWRPANVNVFNVGRDIAWYPLSYRDRYNDFNRNFRRGNNQRRDFGNNQQWSRLNNRPDFNRIPANAIVGIRSKEFGRRNNNIRPISVQTARQHIERNSNNNLKLPERKDRRQDLQKNLAFRQSQTARPVRTGVAARPVGVALDKQLQNDTFRTERWQNRRNNNAGSNVENRTLNNDSRRNDRNTRQNQNSANENRNSTQNQRNIPNRNSSQGVTTNNTPEIRTNNTNQNRVVNQPRNNNSNRRNEENNRQENNNTRSNIPISPRNNNENRGSQPRVERREEPRRETPRQEPRRETPRQEQPRREQPRRETPRQETRRETPRQERRESTPRRESPPARRESSPPARRESPPARSSPSPRQSSPSPRTERRRP